MQTAHDHEKRSDLGPYCGLVSAQCLPSSDIGPKVCRLQNRGSGQTVLAETIWHSVEPRWRQEDCGFMGKNRAPTT